MKLSPNLSEKNSHNAIRLENCKSTYSEFISPLHSSVCHLYYYDAIKHDKVNTETCQLNIECSANVVYVSYISQMTNDQGNGESVIPTTYQMKTCQWYFASHILKARIFIYFYRCEVTKYKTIVLQCSTVQHYCHIIQFSNHHVINSCFSLMLL